MKECPVCGAACFEDMEVCYGCLHSFEEGAQKGQVPHEQISQALESSRLLGCEKPTDEKADNSDVSSDKKKRPAHAPASSKVQERPKRQRAPKTATPKVVIERIDAFDGAENENDEEWTLKLGVPKNCQGITLRLERG